ncbi:MAG: Cobalt-zinc-cadmium resistance protein CzcC [Pseudomonadota bacterium]|jgi:outer membrane protein TolC
MTGRFALVVLLVVTALPGPTARAEEAYPPHGDAPGAAVGATVDELVAIAKAMSPEIQIAALEEAAATARIDGAGSLADPRVSLSVEDWNTNRNGGYFPSNPAAGTTKKLKVSQELPFWGKRDLKREIAEANARRAALLKTQVENELVAKVKVAYAEYHSAHLVSDLARDLKARLDTLAKLARARYAQALGRQQDVTRAEVEKASLEAEIVRTEAERRKARVKINRLLARPLEAPLVEAPAPRPIPAMETLDLAALTERAQRSNPDILAQQATIEGADTARRLAEKGWYPDFEVGVSSVKRDGDWRGYEAMVSMNVPLQGSLRESEIGEAKAMAGAARTRRELRALELGNEVSDAWISLKSAREVEKLLRESQLPQAEIGFQAAAKGYELGRTDLLDVLLTEQQLWKSNIDLVKMRFEQQIRLAELEKLVGGEL